jgi:hypothetical protein
MNSKLADLLSYGKNTQPETVQHETATQSNSVPVIKYRDDIIVLSEVLECHCGRRKERVHCPACGRTKLYGSAHTSPIKLPNSQDVMQGCRTYRCERCGAKFNDIDWYFNCRAPKKIDFAETRKLQLEIAKKEAQEKWMRRIQFGERFEHNDRVKCKAEAGFDPEEIRALMQHAEAMKKRLNQEKKQ